jgi:arylsulfatase A-like enzyme
MVGIMERIPTILGLLMLLGCSAPRPGTLRRPNIVLIVSDDQGYAEMSCQGGDIPTPHLDRLAASGVRFKAGYVTSPYCSPSRAGLLTGRYQQRFGHENNPVERMNDRPEVGLPVSEKTIADHLQAAGYVTGMVGKWHLGVHAPHHPIRRGFDEFYGFLREGHFYGPSDQVVSRLRPREPEYDRLNPILRAEREEATTEYLTAAFGREAGAFIDRHASTPFFLYLPFNAPHSPMQARRRDHERFASIADPHRRIWAAMLASMDDAVGIVLDALRRNGVDRDTLVFFISDNGGPTKELTSRNDPFSGGKGSLLEGGIRVPFIVSWPARLPAGKVEDRPVSALDVLPTALAAANQAVPVGLDGIDLLPYLTGNRPEPPHPVLYWRLGGQLALRKGDWKYVRLRANDPFRLYDLQSDPSETKDLIADHPEQEAALRDLLMTWDRQMIAPLW